MLGDLLALTFAYLLSLSVGLAVLGAMTAPLRRPGSALGVRVPADPPAPPRAP